jgi:hypothetical protein
MMLLPSAQLGQHMSDRLIVFLHLPCIPIAVSRHQVTVLADVSAKAG